MAKVIMHAYICGGLGCVLLVSSPSSQYLVIAWQGPCRIQGLDRGFFRLRQGTAGAQTTTADLCSAENEQNPCCYLLICQISATYVNSLYFSILPCHFLSHLCLEGRHTALCITDGFHEGVAFTAPSVQA